MTAITEPSFSATLVSSAAPEDRLTVIGVDGEEALGSMFRYTVIFTREAGAFTEAQLDELLSSAVTLGFGSRSDESISGRLCEIEEIGLGLDPRTHRQLPLYRATLVPTVWLLTRSRHSRVFMHLSIDQLLREVLGTYGLRESVDYDVRVTPGQVREQITQYRESDWDLLQRWMDHEGYWFWFDHADGAERLVIAESNADTADLSDPRQLVYGLDASQPTVWGFGRSRVRLPARVALIDGRKGMAAMQIVRTEVGTTSGFGTALYDDHHTEDSEHAVHLAEVRAQAERCAGEMRWGATNSSRFHPGLRFELAGHPIAANDGTFLIARTTLIAGVTLGTERRLSSAVRPFTIEFAALPLDVTYCPRRTGHWPSIPGVIRAALAAPADAEGQELRDEKGRYLVRLPFDAMNRSGDRSFAWAPAVVAIGPGAIEANDEVLVAFVEGDPDRPLIVGWAGEERPRAPTVPKGVRLELERL